MGAILGIIAAIAILYLYYLLLRALFLHVAPGVILFTAVIGQFAAPIVYVQAAARTVDRPGARRGWWVPIGIVLFFVCCDYSYVVMNQTMTMIRFTWVEGWLRGMLEPIVLRMWGNQQLIAWAARKLSEPTVSAGVVLLSATAKSILVVPLLLALRGLRDNTMGKRQPACLQYFFSRAFRDLYDIVQAAMRLWFLYIKLAVVGIVRASIALNIGLAFVFPIPLAILVAMIAPIITGTVFMAILCGSHAFGLALIIAFDYAFAVAAQTAEHAVMFLRTRYVKCPHAGCHRPLPLPVFMCPNCGTRHDQLIPGRYGVFLRQCMCGNFLPTLNMFGRNKLAASCPHCSKPINEALFSGNIHLPIYGGRSSGKTMFMTAVTCQLKERQRPGLQAEFVETKDDRSYTTQWKPDFQKGYHRSATIERLPDAFLLSVRSGNGLPVSLYMYDPSGEALVTQSDLEGHRFLSYVDGMALLLDPFTFSGVVKACRSAGQPVPARTSTANPAEIIEQVTNAMSDHRHAGATDKLDAPLAVIISKSDHEIVQRMLGVTPQNHSNSGPWRDAGAEDSETIRTWLEANEPRIHQMLTMRFKNVRYFAVTATGHDETAAGPFTPQGVLTPILWLFSRRRAFVRPGWHRFLWHGTEILAASLVIALFAAGVYATFHYVLAPLVR